MIKKIIGMDWTYGILKSSVKNKKEELVWQRNPIYLDHITIHKNKAISFKIDGQGKIIQISFTSDSKSATLAFEIDNKPLVKVNNGYCLINLCDTRGIGNVQIQRLEENKWRYTFLLPVIFDKQVNVLIVNEAHEQRDIKVSDVHIYYLIPKEVKI